MKKIAVIGSGSWGVALAIHLANLGNHVKIWSFSQEECDFINQDRKCKFLPQASIPENIICTTDIEEAVKGSEIVLSVTPSKFTREIAKKYKDYITDQQVIVCSKGFEKETFYTLDEVLREEMTHAKIGVL